MRAAERGRAIAAALREVAPALAVAVPALVATWNDVVRASWASLGRDQGIFQYVAWAVGQGDVAYRDVRDVNGPVIIMIHALFQALGGTDEHRFRVLDLACTGLSFATAGALVPSIGGARRVSLPARAAWAFAAWVALSAQYLVYGFWDTAQRESFLDWFVLASIALQASTSQGARRESALLFASGVLSVVPWLGKPTFVLFTLPQLVAIVLEPGRRPRRIASFVAGGAVGAIGPLLWLARHGDLRAWAQITFVDVPTMYRFIWHRSASTILSMPGYASLAWTSGLTSVGLILLFARRRLPLRALPIAAMPVLGLVSVVLQAKGFPYHFHPVTLGATFGWIVAAAALWQEPSRVARGVALAGAVGVGVHAAALSWRSTYPREPLPTARDAASLESAERLSAFDRVDFFPRALRDAASFVAAHTRPEQRVQMYGMDAYVLFLARRRSATPYIYAYDLDADAALHGSFDPGGLVPTPEQVERIRALRDAHAHDLRARLEAAPPAAFVFIDRSPLMTEEDARDDFQAHCPDASGWVSAHYREAANFDGIRVWLPASIETAPPPGEAR